jgi:hypothetical protein
LPIDCSNLEAYGWRRAGEVSAARSFDPRVVGALECQTWVTYYRREWVPFLWAALRVTRHAFGLWWPSTLRGAWLVLRANQHWAPFPDNRPDAARRCMRRFYALVARRDHATFDVTEAARLEVEWWRVHRELQHAGEAAVPADDRPAAADEPLVAALCRLYGHVYGATEDDVRRAASERALAMRLSDAWVAQGCERESPLLPRERAALVRSCAALLAAVHRPA